MKEINKYKGITADSRQVVEGGIFVAERGVNVDGHDFISKAIENGASLVVCERKPDNAEKYVDVQWMVVPDSAKALGELASENYGHPSQKLTLVGVTGTNGKTTIATLLYEMAMAAGIKAGLISTVVNKIGTESIHATHTTPDAVTLNSLMAQMVDAGCEFCAMEVSSHACAQKRIAGLNFDGGIFTNLTRDHLDYHKTFANYLAAKKSFFDSLPPTAFALSNIDDRNGTVMLQNTAAKRCTYSVRAAADFTTKVIEDSLGAMVLEFAGNPARTVHTAFTGRFNASNLTAVAAAWQLLGNPVDETLQLLSGMQPVAGRMQTLVSNNGITAIVDYAHTPDALANTLSAIAEATHGKRIITVVGAGGDRDPGKRPQMAAEAAKWSHMVVITSDNPRSEDPAEIARQMLAGIPADYKGEVVEILDRAAAIAYALEHADSGDAVLIAGKGHEDYQIIGKEKRHFDDCEQVAAAFANLTNK